MSDGLTDRRGAKEKAARAMRQGRAPAPAPLPVAVIRCPGSLRPQLLLLLCAPARRRLLCQPALARARLPRFPLGRRHGARAPATRIHHAQGPGPAISSPSPAIRHPPAIPTARPLTGTWHIRRSRAAEQQSQQEASKRPASPLPVRGAGRVQSWPAAGLPKSQPSAYPSHPQPSRLVLRDSSGPSLVRG